MSKLPVLLILFSSLICHAQIPEGFPVIDNNDIPEACFKTPRHFTAGSLYGYINGGAELYREYGIEDAVITEFDIEDSHYKCEVFEMTGQEEAFGIFSVSGYRCLGNPSLAEYACQTRYQLQICKGSYYISIISRNAASADSLILLKAGKIIAGRINQSSFNPEDFFPGYDSREIKNHMVLVKGNLGLMNGAPEWEDYFSEITGYTALIVNTDDDVIISVRINEPEQYNRFFLSHGWEMNDGDIAEEKQPDGAIVKIIGKNHLLIRIKS